MLFNKKIDYLIELGMKLDSNFQKDYLIEMRKVPVLLKHKFKGTESFMHKDLTHDLSFEVNSVCDDTVTSFDLDVTKLSVLNFKESDFSFHIELPDQEKIKNLKIDNLEDVIDTNVDEVYDIMTLEFSNPSLNKEHGAYFEAEDINKLYEFDFVRTKDSYYLVCKQSVEDLESEMFLSQTAIKLTDEDIKMLVIGESIEKTIN